MTLMRRPLVPAIAIAVLLALASPVRAQTLALPATAPDSLAVDQSVIVRPIARDVLGRRTSVSRVLAIPADTTILAASYVSGGQRLTARRIGTTTVRWWWDRTDGRRLVLVQAVRVVPRAAEVPPGDVTPEPPDEEPVPPVDTTPAPPDTAIIPLPSGDIARAAVLDLMGPTVPITDVVARGGAYAGYESRFAPAADKLWNANGGAWTENYYDRAAIYYVHWARGGPASDTARAREIAVNYRRDYLEHNNYGSSPHWAQLDGLALDWLVRGDSASRRAVLRTADALWPYAGGAFQYVDTVGGRFSWDVRIQARVLLSQWLSERLDPGNTKWGARIDGLIPRVLAMQSADGAWRSPGQSCGESMNYMTGLLLDVLARMSDAGRASPAITQAITRGATFLWTQWVPSAEAFQYLSGPCHRNAQGVDVGDVTPAPDLNGIILPAFGWLAAQTSDPMWRTRGDAIVAGMRGAFLSGTKQFNESYTTSWRHLSFRFPVDTGSTAR